MKMKCTRLVRDSTSKRRYATDLSKMVESCTMRPTDATVRKSNNMNVS